MKVFYQKTNKKSMISTYQRLKDLRASHFQDTTKQIDAKLFVEKIQKQKQEHLSHIKSVQEKAEVLKAKQEEDKLEKERVETEKLALEKKNEVQKRYAELQCKAEERKKTIKHILMEKPPDHEYLYENWQNAYNLKASQDLKERLEEQKVYNKKYYQPLNRSEFDIHVQKLREVHKLQKTAFEEQMQTIKEEHIKRKEILKRLQTNTSQKILQMLKDERKKQNQKKTIKLQMKLKMRAYSHIVKETRMPFANPDKIEERIQNICKTHSEKKNAKNKDEIPDYLHSLNAKLKRRSYSNKSKDSLDTSTKTESKVYSNYLQQQRKKREKIGIPKHDWKQELENRGLSRAEKHQLIIEKAKSLEEHARREELLLKTKGCTASDIHLEENISNMYIDAIKAKMAILGNL